MKKTHVSRGVAVLGLVAVIAVVGCTQTEEPVAEAEAPPEPVAEEAAPEIEIGRAPKAAELIGGWKLVSIAGEPAAADFETTIEFDEEGRAGGNAGCNNYGGGYDFDSGSLAFATPFASTKKMCPGPMMKQEGAFLKAMSVFQRASIDGDTLSFYFEGSDAPLVFERIVEEETPN
ncbi:MAG: META domain-containing protein [Thermoanaerobaculales bacterium]|jgi:heat shock protein HslJ|nr:META domain-containing protein [Thermoanaerobaculales bacterium]